MWRWGGGLGRQQGRTGCDRKDAGLHREPQAALICCIGLEVPLPLENRLISSLSQWAGLVLTFLGNCGPALPTGALPWKRWSAPGPHHSRTALCQPGDESSWLPSICCCPEVRTTDPPAPASMKANSSCPGPPAPRPLSAPVTCPPSPLPKAIPILIPLMEISVYLSQISHWDGGVFS